ncbi:hypothetical protein BB560_003786 [Smittium megazygosporum]|uniref:XPG N-terminal domain-containing protein n=2 Tax=Smittium megazygosporum TaxID=133381 RepID=A0A2T9ZB32_9FUNG|nr:hypothetical protein BB560_003786 [Smittium megazygosporum]
MGVHALTPLLKRFAPKSLIERPISFLENLPVAVDMSIFIYKAGLSKDSQSFAPFELYKNFLSFLKDTKVKPVLVFDGQVFNADKYQETKKRKERLEQAKQAVSQLKLQIPQYQELQKLCLFFNLFLISSVKSDSLMYSKILNKGASFLELYKSFKERVDLYLASTPDKKTPLGEMFRKEAMIYDKLSLIFSLLQDSKALESDNSILNTLKKNATETFTEANSLLYSSNARYLSLEIYSSLKPVRSTVEYLEIANSMGFTCHTANGMEAEIGENDAFLKNSASELKNSPEFVDFKGLYGTISEDTDVLAFGGKRLLRSFNTDCEMILEIDREMAQLELGISFQQFIDLCILCGTDFNSRIPKIGPVNALKMIKKYGSIEKIIYSSNIDPSITSSFNYKHWFYVSV